MLHVCFRYHSALQAQSRTLPLTLRLLVLVLIEPGVYVYYNGTYQKNDEPPFYMPGKYSTDVMAESAVEFIEDAASHKDRPFFINVMPVGPHFEPNGPLGTTAGGMLPPVPAERHADMFPGVTVPRTENFNALTVSTPPKPTRQSTITTRYISRANVFFFHTAGRRQLFQDPRQA